MSKPRRKGAAPAGGFSMRFMPHHSSNDESSDADSVSTQPDGGNASLARRIPPARPSQPPSGLVAGSISSAPGAESAIVMPGPSPPCHEGEASTAATNTSSAVAGPSDDWEFVMPEDLTRSDHFGKRHDALHEGRHADSQGRSSFYSHSKSELANTYHDLTLSLSSQTGRSGDGKEVPWKRKRSSALSLKRVTDAEMPFGTSFSPGRLSILAFLMMLFLLCNSSPFLMGTAVGAYALFHVGLLLLYNITKQVPHHNDYTIDFEELHAAMVAEQPATSGDGITLMQPKTILKESFAVAQEYAGPTNFRSSEADKMQLRLCGNQLRMSALSVPEDIPLLEINKLLADSCSDNSSCSDMESGEEGEFPGRRRRSGRSTALAFVTSSKSYSLLGSKVSLAPEGLNQRQRWSKKLPLHLVIDTDAQFSSQEDIPSFVLAEGKAAEAGAKSAGMAMGAAATATASAVGAPPPCQFFLFAPTGRVKQDWYMRLKLASDPGMVSRDLASVPAEHSQYARYMDFLLIHLHPGRAKRFNFLRNDALITSNQILRLVSDAEELAMTSSLASSMGSSASLASSVSVSSSMTSLDRQDAPMPGSLSKQTSRTSMGPPPAPAAGIIPDPRHSLRGGSLLWFNAALGRLFYDAWREPRWADKLRVRWQRKLSRLKTPSYIRQLNMTELHLGHSIPIVKKFGQPRIDSRGLWIDVGISYRGNFHVTIETAMNLAPLLEEQVTTPAAKVAGGEDDGVRASVSMIDVQGSSVDVEDDDLSTDSDMDSGADDDDGEVHDTSSGPTTSAAALATATSVLQSLEKSFPALSGTISQVTGLATGSESNAPTPQQQQHQQQQQQQQQQQEVVPVQSSSSKFKRFAGYVAHTRIGQSVMKSNVVKKLSEKVSNMPLVLTVELRQLAGTMTINFPPPPSGVIWFSFSKPPDITLVAKPRVGQREVKVNQVTDWIERKLISEFKKRLVMPNMEDIAIPLMSSGVDEADEGKPVETSSSNPRH